MLQTLSSAINMARQTSDSLKMNPRLDRRFPSVADMRAEALRRLPRFMGEYLSFGMGRGGGTRRNRRDLQAVELMPRYCCDASQVTTEVAFCGQRYAAPFGVAPVGNGGLAWPRAPELLCEAARRHQIPFTSSTFSFLNLEKIKAHAGDCAWFQLYRPNARDIETDLLARAEAAGYQTLLVTVDVPSPTRRDHDIRNGFSLPPRMDTRTVLDLITHPAWSLAVALYTMKSGFPAFENFKPYLPAGLSRIQAMEFASQALGGHVGAEAFAGIRELWPGTLVAKGVLSPEDALRYRDLGADAIAVSNHGGRQLESAPSTARALPAIRKAVGEDYPLIVDSGVRSGLDICRMIALGANFVLMGRAFYYALAAIGPEGAEHVMQLLKAELVCTMGQLGCVSLDELPDRLSVS